MPRTYKWGYPDKNTGQYLRLTEEQLKNKWSWANVHPEMQRRALACANAAQDDGFDLGFGEGARNPVQQLAEFFNRHTLVSSGGCCTWNGKRYKLKPGMSPISPPGSSNHDDDIYEGCALAIDFNGWETHWFDANCERFGIKNFGGLIGPGVNGEEWHGQPLELPNSRKDVNAYFARGGKLQVWPLPGGSVPSNPPTPQPHRNELNMIIDLNFGTAWWVSMLLDGDEITHITNGHHVDVLVRGGTARVNLGTPQTPGEVELDGILRSVSATNNSPFAPGMPAYNQGLHDLWLAAQARNK